MIHSFARIAPIFEMSLVDFPVHVFSLANARHGIVRGTIAMGSKLLSDLAPMPQIIGWISLPITLAWRES